MLAPRWDKVESFPLWIVDEPSDVANARYPDPQLNAGEEGEKPCRDTLILQSGVSL